jgi:uncharacterized protein (DUF433 family)
MELLSPKSRWYPFVSVDPDRLSGEPVFRGTRVPVRVLFECMRKGMSLDQFLDEFEGVPKKFAVAALTMLTGDLAAEIERDTRKKASPKRAKAA